MALTLERLTVFVRQSFELRTSSRSEEWHSENPAFGQCAVAALVLQDHFGGDIVAADIPTHWHSTARFTGHVWNRINGRDIDITADQFEKRFPYGDLVRGVFGPVSVQSREEMLAHAPLAKNYQRLRASVDRLLVLP